MLVILVVIRQTRFEFVFSVRAICTIIFFSIILLISSPIIEYITEISEEYESFKYCLLIVKGIGISFIIKVTSDICKDMGEVALGTYIEIVGKLQLILLVLPIIKEIIDTIKEIIT